MMTKTYKLTKSKIASGLQCKKKLWFDIHEPAKKVKKATFERGERFNEVIRKHYTKIHGIEQPKGIKSTNEEKVFVYESNYSVKRSLKKNN